MTKHAELIARLEAAEVGSPSLDMIISVETDQWWIAGEKFAGPWTQSLDAAIALAERVLGEEAALDALYKTSAVADTIKLMPLDLCIAILKALDAQ